jgi:hypothetical protein
VGMVEADVQAELEELGVRLVGVSSEKVADVNVGWAMKLALGRPGWSHLRVKVVTVSERTGKLDIHSLLSAVEAVEGLDQKHPEVVCVYQA